MKNNIKTFTLFIRNDPNSEHIASTIRKLSKDFLTETNDGDLIIAIGGDGTFIDAVTSTYFNKDKIYAGINTGHLGFFQNLSADEVFALIKYLNYEKEINTRKIFIPTMRVNLTTGEKLYFHILNEVLIAGKNRSKISFSEYVNGELFQNVSADTICVASNVGDTARSMNAGGSIDFSDNFQLVRTLEIPIQNAANERFIRNPIICSNYSLKLDPSDNIQIIIDGIAKEIISEEIVSVDVSMFDDSNYINKFELETYSKTKVIREKILGYIV